MDGIYFSSVVAKPKEVRCYFFPLYTHSDEIGELPENLSKCLKGKTCMHIKNMDLELESGVKLLVRKSIGVYKDAGLL